ncbi:MAG: glycosyltransferase [Candidatus Thorarchaeota archaeon]
MAKILMATHSPAPDYRIDREAEALAKDGHELYLIYPQLKRKMAEVYKESFLIPLNLRQRALGPIASRMIARKYNQVIKKIQPDVIHAHDITAANIIRFVIPKNTKFVYDDHEIWEFLRKRQADATKNIIKKVIVKGIQFLTKRINRIITKKADLIVVINEHWINYYQKKGINPTKIISVENYASKNLIQEVEASKSKIDDFFITDKRKKIVHSSKLKLSAKVVRDVSNFAQAAQELDDWVMVVFSEVDEEFAKLGVKFIEPKPRMEYLASIAKCDVALNTLLLDERFHYSSSNRLYEFIALGLRVIVSPAQTYIDKFGDALIYAGTETSKDDLVKILKNIESYPTGVELRKFLEKYNWEDEVSKLVSSYQKMLHS